MYKFLIIDTYYYSFLNNFYKNNTTKNKTYEEHLQFLMQELVGTADFYSKNLKKLGCEAAEVIFNDFKLQYKWLKEHAPSLLLFPFSQKLHNYHKIINKIGFIPWQLQEPYRILKAQIEYYKPDILYIQDIRAINDRFLLEIKKEVKLIVGQIASVIPKDRNLKVYDLIVTSFPHFLNKFRDLGINAEYLKIAFEPAIWDRISNEALGKRYNCTFIGGLKKRTLTKRIELLEVLADKIKLDIWGYGIEELPKTSSIRKSYHSEAWGIDMYRILAQSKITINIHVDAAKNYANNMRLYESTGCDAMLITDYKDNLDGIFKIGEEVVAYKDVDELYELIKYYINNDKERQAIANAGQKKTLSEHTYYNRMVELLDILKKYVN